MSIYIGIDPGKSGAMAVIITDENNQPFTVKTVAFDETEYCKMLAECVSSRVICCIEKVGAMPGQGVVSMFNFGRNLGYSEGLLQANKISYQLVPPQTWKKEFSLIGKDKQASIEVCRRLFPHANLLATSRSRKPHDGIAEALLMAEYARRKL